MVARIDDAMILAQQLVACVFGDGAELVVNVSDFPLRICDGNDGMHIERGLQIADLPERRFELIFHSLVLCDHGHHQPALLPRLRCDSVQPHIHGHLAFRTDFQITFLPQPVRKHRLEKSKEFLAISRGNE
jgi:hypothetical protein